MPVHTRKIGNSFDPELATENVIQSQRPRRQTLQRHWYQASFKRCTAESVDKVEIQGTNDTTTNVALSVRNHREKHPSHLPPDPVIGQFF